MDKPTQPCKEGRFPLSWCRSPGEEVCFSDWNQLSPKEEALPWGPDLKHHERASHGGRGRGQ